MTKKEQLLIQKEEALTKCDFEEYTMILLRLIRGFPTNKDEYYHDCNRLIEFGAFNAAKKVLKELKLYSFESFAPIQKFLEKKVALVEQYQNLSEEAKEQMNTFIEVGRSAFREQNYALAENYFSAGLTITEDPIFYYYLGKTYYEYEKLTFSNNQISKHYFLELLKNGYWKYQKSILYLSCIYEREKNYRELQKILELGQMLGPFSAELFWPYHYEKEPNQTVEKFFRKR